MLTSELIKKLQNELEIHGDLPVVVPVSIDDDDGGYTEYYQVDMVWRGRVTGSWRYKDKEDYDCIELGY